MSTLFYVSGAIAVISAVMLITRPNAMHAVLYLLLLLVSVASVFFTLGAPFAAALQLLIYAGAILVLFVFVVMILDLGPESERRERAKIGWKIWVVPAALAAVLLAQFAVALGSVKELASPVYVAPRQVGVSLYTDYLVGVELASLLLIAGLVAAFHIGFRAVGPEAADE